MSRFPAYQVFCLVFAVLAMSSCADTLAKLESKPHALGVMNEVVAVSDSNIWNSAVQDSFRFYFGSPYPIMPTPEPLFDIRHFTTEELMSDPLRKELRTYVILADLSDKDSPTTKMARNDLGEEAIRRFYEDPEFYTTAGMDKWAKGQLIVYILGENQADLANHAVAAFPTIAKRITQHDARQLLQMTYLNGNDRALAEEIERKFGFTMTVPGDFEEAISQDNFLWLRKDETEITSSIMIKSFPYRSEEQLEKEGLIEMRDRMGVLIQSGTVGSIMQTNSSDLPVYLYDKNLDGRYSIEARGIWEMSDDFMGGPFINYAIVDGDRIIIIDAFIFAPGKEKRDMIQQLELIVSSIKFNS